jgi:hypothetical protein
MDYDKVFIKPDYSVACIEYHICMECDNGVAVTLAKCYDSNLAHHIRESVLDYFNAPNRKINSKINK